jgi:hypothetical protein
VNKKAASEPPSRRRVCFGFMVFGMGIGFGLLDLEIRDQRSEVRDQRSEVRGQRSEVRGQRSEVRGQRS